MNTCPSCQCQFLQRFVCTTCGAAKLHDAELRSAHARAVEAERLLRLLVEDYNDSVGQVRREIREYIARLPDSASRSDT